MTTIYDPHHPLYLVQTFFRMLHLNLRSQELVREFARE